MLDRSARPGLSWRWLSRAIVFEDMLLWDFSSPFAPRFRVRLLNGEELRAAQIAPKNTLHFPIVQFHELQVFQSRSQSLFHETSLAIGKQPPRHGCNAMCGEFQYSK